MYYSYGDAYDWFGRIALGKYATERNLGIKEADSKIYNKNSCKSNYLGCSAKGTGKLPYFEFKSKIRGGIIRLEMVIYEPTKEEIDKWTLNVKNNPTMEDVKKLKRGDKVLIYEKEKTVYEICRSGDFNFAVF